MLSEMSDRCCRHVQKQDELGIGQPLVQLTPVVLLAAGLWHCTQSSGVWRDVQEPW